MRAHPVVVALLSLAAACVAGCRGDLATAGDAATPVDADLGPDGPDGTGYTPTTPRTVAPETFVGPSGLEPRLIALIDGAQTSLDLQMYLFSDTALGNRVVAAKARGVAVRVILDPGESANKAVRPMFQAQGVPLRDAPAIYTYAHAKYMVIDHTTAVIMSMNFNPDAMRTERNYGVIDRDPEDVYDLALIFRMDWAAAGAETPRPANLDCTRLVVSPDNSKTRILTLIGGATTTLDVEAMYVADASVRTAITNAKARGVAVRVILEDPNENQETSTDATPFLKAAGIEVKLATSAQFYLHAKLIIADGVAMVGSENYSQTSLSANREVGALIFEPAAVAPIQTQFEADWAATADAP